MCPSAETDEMCPTPISTPSSPRTEKSEASNIEVNCEEKKAMDSARSKISENHADSGALNEGSQTRRETGSNPENPHSYSVAPDSHNRQEPLEPCVDKPSKPPTPRNPITGLGLGNDGVGGLKPKKPRSRRGDKYCLYVLTLTKLEFSKFLLRFSRINGAIRRKPLRCRLDTL